MKQIFLILVLPLIFSCEDGTNNALEEEFVINDNCQNVKSDSLPIEFDSSSIDSVFSYYHNGKVKSLKISNERKLTEIEYYFNGNKKSEYNYFNDTLDGLVLTYYDNGQLEVSRSYKRGKSHGNYLFYRIDGTLKEKIIDNEGEIIWVGKYDEKGKLIFESTFNKGKVINSQVY